MMLGVILILALSTVTGFWLYFNERNKFNRFFQNEKILSSYLTIHSELQRAAQCTLKVEKLDTDNLMVWKQL